MTKRGGTWTYGIPQNVEPWLELFRTKGMKTQVQARSRGFQYLARRVSNYVGSPWAFLIACMTVLVWGVTGPLFGFSDTWQLVINTGTTIVTFLMVFLIQHAQNPEAAAAAPSLAADRK